MRDAEEAAVERRGNRMTRTAFGCRKEARNEVWIVDATADSYGAQTPGP